MKNILLISIIIISIISCKNSKVVEEKYENGKTKSIKTTLENGLVEELYYYENGKIQQESFFKNSQKDSTWTFYFQNGKTWSMKNYKEGKLNGYSAVYFPNGKLYYEGDYKNDLKQGKWYFYNDIGVNIKLIEYLNDSIIESFNY